MKVATYLRNYNKYKAHSYYLVGFEYKGNIYFARLEKLTARYVRVGHSSHKNGYNEKLNLYIKARDKARLAKSATMLCSADEFASVGNKGWKFEEMIFDHYGIEYKGLDNKPFYVSGDITIDNEEVQLKFDGAQIVTEKTLNKLKKAKYGL